MRPRTFLPQCHWSVRALAQGSGFSVAQYRTQFPSSWYVLQGSLCPSPWAGLPCQPSLIHLFPGQDLPSRMSGLFWSWVVGPWVDPITLPQIVLRLPWSHCHEKYHYPDRKKDTEEAFGLDLSQRQTDIRTALSLNQRTKCQVHLWRKRPRTLCWSNSQLYLRLFV